MRILSLLLLLPVLCFAQTDKNISVVSAENMNIVYRGLSNPIKIAMPGAKNFTVTTDSAGNVQADTINKGYYKVSPGSGSEFILKIDAVLEDGSKLHEEKVFRIKPLPMLIGQIKGFECVECEKLAMTKKEIEEAEVKINWEDFLFISNPEENSVYSFKISFPNKKNAKFYTVEGYKMSDVVRNYIKKLKKGDFIYIDGIVYLKDTTHITPKKARPIMIEIRN